MSDQAYQQWLNRSRGWLRAARSARPDQLAAEIDRLGQRLDRTLKPAPYVIAELTAATYRAAGLVLPDRIHCTECTHELLTHSHLPGLGCTRRACLCLQTPDTGQALEAPLGPRDHRMDRAPADRRNHRRLWHASRHLARRT